MGLEVQGEFMVNVGGRSGGNRIRGGFREGASEWCGAWMFKDGGVTHSGDFLVSSTLKT